MIDCFLGDVVKSNLEIWSDLEVILSVVVIEYGVGELC